MCAGFASDLRVATMEGRLSAVWFHPANELAGVASKVSAAIARALGLHPGVADYIFIWEGGCAALEAKAPKGRQSPNQKLFQAWCAANGVPYHIFRTREEGLYLLRGFGVLT